MTSALLGQFIVADPNDGSTFRSQPIYVVGPGIALWPSGTSSQGDEPDGSHAELGFQSIGRGLRVQVGELPFEPEDGQACELSFGGTVVQLRVSWAEQRHGGWSFLLVPADKADMHSWLSRHADQLWGVRRSALTTDVTVTLVRDQDRAAPQVFRVPSSSLVRSGAQWQVWISVDGLSLIHI